jgi:hypothetical protein
MLGHIRVQSKALVVTRMIKREIKDRSWLRMYRKEVVSPLLHKTKNS